MRAQLFIQVNEILNNIDELLLANTLYLVRLSNRKVIQCVLPMCVFLCIGKM